VPERAAVREVPPVRAVHESVEALLGAGARRLPMQQTAGVSGARFERVARPDGDFVLKLLDRRHDWTMRAMGDLYGTSRRLWERGILDLLPPCIHQPIVGVAAAGDGSRAVWLLMRDVGRWLVPDVADPVPLAQHRGFLDHMAAVHATFWDGSPAATRVDRTLTPLSNWLLDLSPWMASTEAALGSDAVVPRLVGEGWERFAGVVRPSVAGVVRSLVHDPTPLVAAFGDTPTTLVHGNWKFGNLGTDDEGRTVLLDWEGTGCFPATLELAWYLAINCRRVTESKEDAIAAYRAALEAHGVATAGWWDRQVALSLLAGLVWFGWEKALGGERDDELAWWEDRVDEGARHL
jgi:hypothetical protein